MSVTDHDRVEAFLRARMESYLELLESWVSVNSFTRNREGVNRLGELTSSAFEELGFGTERIPSENPDFGDHFILTRAGSGEQTIGLVSHLDTVFPAEEESANGFRWRVEGDRVYGPGTVDIKGGTLMIYMVLEALQNQYPEIFESVHWVVLLDASEETLSEDFGRICLEQLKGAAACLVFEGGFFEEGTFNLVRTRKGMAKFRICVEGKAAHAGVSHADGANALVQLAETIRSVASLTDYERRITFNIGWAAGGTVPNRVPHAAEALGEMRAFDMAVFEEGVEALRRLEKDVAVVSKTGASCAVRVDVFQISPPWPRNDDTDSLLSLWDTVGNELGYRLFPEDRGGLSDGNHTWGRIPTLDGLGPGGGNAHCSEYVPENGKEQEYLYLPSLLPKAVLNVLAIVRLASG